ncbi:PREDICTED: UV excision repair protein rhp23-like [Bactrocera latifrons]|uniref:UV excision repair protein RAD23 n=1 Tax=Bactrocera latifrons TaxID=174628 RepID=A0A0K8V112_BACLA|nr:PREDICTED: UV excision repair protein rhp23-like [Bactrocera latifrons]
MKLTIKNLDHKSFVINTYGLKTVSDLKRKLYNVAVTNLLPERQQLLYAGRVLKDNKLLSSYSIDERKFLLVMARKPWRTSNIAESIHQTTNNNNNNNKNKWMTEISGQKPANVGQGDELNNKGAAKDMTEQRRVRIKHIKKKPNSKILMAKSSIKLKASKSIAKKRHKSQNKFKTRTSSSASLSHEDSRTNNKIRQDSASSIESTDSKQARCRCHKVKITANNKTMKSTKSLLSTNRLRATKKASKMQATKRKILKKSTQNRVCDEHVLRQIVAMGYREDDVRRALVASFNNPNEAVDYLIKQMQERVGHQTAIKQKQQQRRPQTANQHKAKTTEQTKLNQANALTFLRQDPDFKNLRRLLRKRPYVLQDVIRRIDETQPELLLMLKEHESEFLQLLHESSAESEDEQCSHCNYNHMHISPEEEKHIARLVRMGFKRQMVILAFIACDRNVERAVDYLCRIDDIHM